MRPVKIITDSCSDLSGELLEKYNIDYARMNTVRDGKETEASLTWENYSPKELYDIMRGGERITTTQVPVNEFMRIFGKYLSEGFDIIYIGCALKQSGSVNTGKVAAADILKKYPDARITCIDSLNASIGEGMLAIFASELNSRGKSYDEIVEAVMDHRNLVNEYVTVHSLDSLKRAGRVKASAAFFGNLMGVKPIIISDADGEQTPIKKVRGRVKSLEETADLLAASITEPENQSVYIAHADCSEEELKTMTDLVRSKIKCRDIVPVIIGPIIGASIGPDAIGLWAFGKEITYRVGEAR